MRGKGMSRDQSPGIEPRYNIGARRPCAKIRIVPGNERRSVFISAEQLENRLLVSIGAAGRPSSFVAMGAGAL